MKLIVSESKTKRLFFTFSVLIQDIVEHDFKIGVREAILSRPAKPEDVIEPLTALLELAEALPEKRAKEALLPKCNKKAKRKKESTDAPTA